MFSHRDTEEQGNEFSPDLSKPSRGHESQYVKEVIYQHPSLTLKTLC